MSLNRSVAPAIADLTTDLSITPEVRQTPSGARLHIFKNSIQPVVRVEFIFKAGKWFQPKAGVASLTAKMLKEGTQLQTAKEIADAIDFYGASLDVAHGYDRSTVTLYCLAKFLPSLLPLAFEIIQHPTFPQNEFSLMKQRVVQTLAVDKQKNSYLATEAYTSAIYGKDHPYASYISEEDIEAIEIQDLQDFHRRAYTFHNAEIFITGDIQNDQIDNLTGKLEATTSTDIEQAKIITLSPKTGLIVSPTANEMQASLRAGKPVLRPSHPDYPALYLLNHVLGGYFGSRLMKNIREDKGFTYGIYSSISHKENGSLLSIGTDIKGDKIEETLEEVSKELSTLREELVPEEELITTKKHMAGKFLSDHATLFDKMDKYKSNVIMGLAPDFYTQLLADVQELSAPTLLEAANKYLVEEDFLRVVAGGKTK